MALKTREQFMDSVAKLKPRLFIAGERVENMVEHPNIIPVINTLAKTYELEHDPEYEELTTATSHLTGEKINRWIHVPQNIDDLHKSSMLITAMSQKLGVCHYRCGATEAVHVLSSLTRVMDQKLGTEYNKRFTNYLRYLQENDLTAGAPQTDPKGDRTKRPSQQQDPDTFLHVAKKTEDGIIVRGAKLHQLGGMVTHEHIVFPPIIPLGKGEEDYAVCFAVPNGTKGLTYIAQSGPMEAERREAKDIQELGIPEYGSEVTTMIVFDDVFVPWERVFLCGELEFTSYMLDKFVRTHNVLCRGGCKVGYMDLIIGAAQTIAEYNGIAGAAHVRDKITEMVRTRETTRACVFAACQNAKEDPPGSSIYYADSMWGLMASTCMGFGFQEAMLLAADLAGGAVVTMPSERELKNPETSHYIQKYLRATPSVPAEKRMRMLKFLQHWTAGPQGILSWHSAGSMQGNRLLTYNEAVAGLEEKKRMAKELAGIKD